MTIPRPEDVPNIAIPTLTGLEVDDLIQVLLIPWTEEDLGSGRVVARYSSDDPTDDADSAYRALLEPLGWVVRFGHDGFGCTIICVHKP